MPPTSPPPTPPANAERLLKLRAAVVNAPLEQFKMARILCGTQSCAAGWYVRANPDCGLKFRMHTEDGKEVSDLIVHADPKNCRSDALAQHFGISNEDETYLFFDFTPGDPAAQKSEFLAKLDALLASSGIASPAGTRATEGAAK